MTQQPPCDKGLIQAAAGAGTLSPADRKWVLAATVLGSSLAFIDGSVVGVALPAMQRDLHASAEATPWIVNGYMLFLGALVLIGGAAADRFGRKAVFLIGLAIFTAASVVCGLAPGVEVLLAGRMAQGLGAALLTPASLAILGSSFPEKERGKAIGAWAGFGALTAAAGPVLGGFLVDHLGWRSIFFINLPLALGAALLAWRALPESRDEDAKGLDLAGAALAAGGLGLLIWGLTRAGDKGLGDPAALSGLIAGLVLLAGFVAVEDRSANAMAPLTLFRSRDFSGANLLTLFLYFALSGSLFFLPFQLIRIEGWPATQAGAALLPFSLLMGFGSGLAGRLSSKIGPRWPLTVGPLIAAAGLVGMALSPGLPYLAGLLPATLALGVGMTISVAPLTTTVMADVSEKHAGTASGINSAVARIAGLLAVAVLTLAFTAAGGTLAATPDPPAFERAYRLVMLISAACAALAGVFGGLMVRGRDRG
ncbi:EmrB/QacA subfamily drug resistance transporter [Caulobacter ginsengisoli]|uniref:EmrB/QacA subfamily drug resistance transporter n=1 Tax=Caulobacter ginsengisoli TaxID=400775 RepID=A0ABU0IYA2_9CAUL|nr:MFS transporter [Caulobacter ginsengisoli]MDQ0466984.1 EmrB/QacA subfamily drug resistance transporter [Caulobacter ginsengisoli]